MNKLATILIDLEHHNITFDEAYPQVLALIAENETGVSDSPPEHGDLPLVRRRNAERKVRISEDGEAEHGTLGKITETKEEIKCPECLSEVDQQELDMFGGLCEECSAF